ncbi:MAG: IS982 family transposase, partial [Prevotellaceae bacterium]|nr:IS982 family transposase [Prevotellaceae bacterium]
MLTADEVTTIFFLCDESSKNFDKVMNAHLLLKDDGKRHRNRKFRLSDSEVMTILVMFHLSHTRDLKSFYLSYIQRHCKELFPETVSYNRFVELQGRVVVKMAVFLQLCCLGRCTGFSIIDSTPIRACHIK